jgi:hypothetical protein
VIPAAAGCPGAIAKLATSTSAPSFKTSGAGSQMAGPDAAFKQQPGAGLSSAAKAALGLNSNGADSANNGAANSLSSFATDGSGADLSVTAGAGAYGSANHKTDAASIEKEKSKFNFGSFGSLGGAISGFFGGSKKSSDSNKFSKDQVEAARRQIASEKVRSEISSASGKSNWDKVTTRYNESSSSFLGQ